MGTMNYKGKEINATVINGNKFKFLVSSNSGTLIYKKSNLCFIPHGGYLEVRIMEVPDEAVECVGFVSENFKKLNKLDITKDYILVFCEDCIKFFDKETGKLVLSIPGTSF